MSCACAFVCSVSSVVSLLDVEDMKNQEERALMLQVSKITEGPPCVPLSPGWAWVSVCVADTAVLLANACAPGAAASYDRPAPDVLKAYIRALKFEPNAPPPPTPLGACHRGLKQLCKALLPSAWKSDVRGCAHEPLVV